MSYQVVCRALDWQLTAGLRHTTHPAEGLQFHPESILTKHGAAIIRTFISAAFRPGR